MEEQYFISPIKMTETIAETIIPGNHIVVGGYQYERVGSKPRGRRIMRKLLNLTEDLKLVIYS